MTGPPSAVALATINTPLVTTLSGAAAAASLPALQGACVSGAVPWRLLNLAAYALNFYATGQPGRLDGANRAAADITNELADLLTERDKSLLNPQGWAFIIWAPIFMGELALTVSSLLLIKDGSAVASILQTASAAFAVAQIFQTLWAATFRPSYIKKEGISTWISAGMLTGIAASLSVAHAVYAESPLSKLSAAFVGGESISNANYLLYFLPMSLHFGWTTAAALVNWNGNVAMLCSNEKVVAGVAWTSVVAATVVGVVVTVSRNAPVYGGVIAWALAACAGSMKERVIERDNRIAIEENTWWLNKKNVADIKSGKGFYGAAVQKWLCTAGAVVSAGAAIYTLLKPNDPAP